jgi:hypothetical protein
MVGTRYTAPQIITLSMYQYTGTAEVALKVSTGAVCIIHSENESSLFGFHKNSTIDDIRKEAVDCLA